MIHFEIKIILKEANYFDQINMTKNRLEFRDDAPRFE